MKTKLLLLALMSILVLSVSSCEPDIYQHQYPPAYRTYQDNAHGGMDNTHGGMNGSSN